MAGTFTSWGAQMEKLIFCEKAMISLLPFTEFEITMECYVCVVFYVVM